MTDRRDQHRTRQVPPNVRAQTASPVEIVEDEDSAAYDIPERAEMRAKRPTDRRVKDLEAKHDNLVDDVRDMRGEITTVRVAVGEMSGKVTAVFDLMSRADALATREATAAETRALAIIAASDKVRIDRAKFWLTIGKSVIALASTLGVAYLGYKAAGQ